MTPGNGPVESTLASGSLSREGKLVIVGTGGVVLTSDDRGRTFNVTVRSDRVALASAKSLPNGNMLLVGKPGVFKAGPYGRPAAQ